MDETRFLLQYNLQMFAKDGPGGEKTEPATSKKKSDTRKEGQVAKSKDLNKAGFDIVMRFARALKCDVSELFE